MNELQMVKIALVVFTLVIMLIMVTAFAIVGSVKSSKIPSIPPKKNSNSVFISPDKKPGGII